MYQFAYIIVCVLYTCNSGAQCLALSSSSKIFPLPCTPTKQAAFLLLILIPLKKNVLPSWGGSGAHTLRFSSAPFTSVTLASLAGQERSGPLAGMMLLHPALCQQYSAAGEACAGGEAHQSASLPPGPEETTPCPRWGPDLHMG